jgi:hypothetical protein
VAKRDRTQSGAKPEDAGVAVRDYAEMHYDQPADHDLLGRTEFASSLAVRIDRMTASG